MFRPANTKYNRSRFANLALLVDYVIEIKKLNLNHKDSEIINSHADEIIKQLLLLSKEHDIDAVFKDISPFIIKLLNVTTLLQPDNKISVVDTNGEAKEVGMDELIQAIKKEVQDVHQDDWKGEMNNVRNLTLGTYYMELWLPEALAKLKHFVDFLKGISCDEDNFESIEREYRNFLETIQKKFKELGLQDSAPKFIYKVLQEAVAKKDFDAYSIYKLRHFADMLVKKEDDCDLSTQKGRESSRYYQGMSYYLANPTGNLFSFLNDASLSEKIKKLGIKKEEIEGFIKDNTNVFFENILMVGLVREVKLEDMANKVDSLFPKIHERNSFNLRFFIYQVQNADQVCAWQRELHNPKKSQIGEANKQKKLPQLDLAKQQEQDKSVYHANVRSIVTNKSHHDQDSKTKEMICMNFIIYLKHLIETTQWNARGILGYRIKVHGKSMKLPTHVAKIYKECIKATSDKDWISHYNKIAILGSQEIKPHRFDFFGLRTRSETTQEFDSDFHQAFTTTHDMFVKNKKKT
jgi:hypothetical protein